MSRRERWKRRRILVNHVVRREIRATTEPDGTPARQTAQVRMHGRDMWAARMQHERKTGRAKHRTFTGQGARQPGIHVAGHIREAHACPFEQISIGQHAGAASPSLGTLPCVPPERLAVERFQPGHDAILNR